MAVREDALSERMLMSNESVGISLGSFVVSAVKSVAAASQAPAFYAPALATH
jgi:hypothetical protein